MLYKNGIDTSAPKMEKLTFDMSYDAQYCKQLSIFLNWMKIQKVIDTYVYHKNISSCAQYGVASVIFKTYNLA
jgi:hypothetical protein